MTELPTTFGKYYLTEKLATGGMAEIYLAKIIGPGGFEKPLVIKQIHPKLSGQRHFVDLFVAEAKTLVTLTHGNIVPVYELGVVDDTYFIAMDYIDGPTLYRLTETMARRDAIMDPALAAWITGRMLEGLDYAHRKGEGVIHRDLSPRNVMLSRDGEVKLVDFGIAVTLGEPGEAGGESAPTGSFPYMSPEQVRREALTVQTDLFSAGVLMWEMLAGRRLFQRSEADATLDAVLREDIARPSTVRPEVPAKLDEIVMRALERDRDARWTSAGDMLAAINKFLYSLADPPGPRDVAALVAKFCPPETRRLPTHLEAVAQDAPGGDTVAEPAGDAEPPAASGPATAVIPREAAARGKPQRHKSFATNVDLAPIFEGTRPLPRPDARAAQVPTTPAAIPATDTSDAAAAADPPASETSDASDAVPTAAEDAPPASPAPSRRSMPRLAAVEEPIDTRGGDANETDDTPVGATGGDRRPALPVPGRTAPTRGLLVVIGIGGIALAAASVWMFFRGRDRVLGEERDAAVLSAPADAALADGGEPPVDAEMFADPADAGVVAVDAQVAATARDSGVTTTAMRDARVDLAPTTRDAGVRRPDATAGTLARPDAALARPDGGVVDATARGTATLKVGADPWGEIYVDGKLVGRTPRELVVPAGRHTVEIVFPAENPPRKQTFAVDLAPGESKPLQADFRN